MRDGNTKKARLLVAAMFAQLGALIALATTLYVVLLSAWYRRLSTPGAHTPRGASRSARLGRDRH